VIGPDGLSSKREVATTYNLRYSRYMREQRIYVKQYHSMNGYWRDVYPGSFNERLLERCVSWIIQ